MGMIKGHKFKDPEQRKSLYRKQRRKESEMDRATVKQRKGIVHLEKEKTPRKKKQKQTAHSGIELTDANLKDVMSRYTLADADEGRPLAVGQPPEVVAQIDKMRAEGKTVYEIFRALGIPLHTHRKE